MADKSRKPGRTAGAHFDFRNVTSADETGRAALHHYSASLAPGAMHVLDLHAQVVDQGTINVLIDMLSASHQNYEGAALADSISIRDLNRRSWRTGTELYTGAQDLVAGSISQNIALTHPKGGYGGVTEELALMLADHLFHELPQGMETELLPCGSNLTAYLSEVLPLAIKLASRPRMLIVRDEIQPLQDDQKQKIVERVAAYARKATVVVFSADPVWRQAALVQNLSDPSLASA